MEEGKEVLLVEVLVVVLVRVIMMAVVEMEGQVHLIATFALIQFESQLSLFVVISTVGHVWLDGINNPLKMLKDVLFVRPLVERPSLFPFMDVERILGALVYAK